MEERYTYAYKESRAIISIGALAPPNWVFQAFLKTIGGVKRCEYLLRRFVTTNKD